MFRSVSRSASAYELPFGHGKQMLQTGVLAHIVGGWSMAGILAHEGGGTLRISIPNNSPIFNGYLRPNRVSGVPIRIGEGQSDFQPLNGLSGQRGDLFLNKDAFAIPGPFTLGNLGVFLPDVRSFGSHGEDLSISRRITIKERRRIELRGDFFNAFNRRNLSGPVTDLSNANFGRITGQGAARIIQLGSAPSSDIVRGAAQKRYFKPNCISRLLMMVEVMRPKSAAPTVRDGALNCGVLVKLNDSQRN